MTAAPTFFPGFIPPTPTVTLQSPARPIRARFEEILTEVCAAHLVSREELLGRGRRQDVVAARREFCVRARREGASYPVIAWFVGRDHTSIMYLVRSA